MRSGAGATLRGFGRRFADCGEPPTGRAVGKGMLIEALVKAFPGFAQHGAQTATRIQDAAAAILTEAFDDCLIRFQGSHQCTQPHVIECLCKRCAAAAAAHRAQDAERRQILNDLVEMVSGQAAELAGYLLNVDVLTRFLAPEQHQDAKGDVGRGEEAH